MNVVINSCLDTPPKGSVLIPNQGYYYHHIVSMLGYPLNEPPVADLLRRLHGLDGAWLVVSPLHWQATHNDAMVMATGDDLQLTEEEGRAWFDAFADFVSVEGMRVYYHDACTWLIQLNEHPNVSAKPVRALLHQSIMPQLEALDKTFFWQRFMTESQMFFSGHALNKARQGRCSINGLWIWGGGVLRAPGKSKIVVDDPSLLPMAELLSTNVTLYSMKQTYSNDTLVLWNNQDTLVCLQTTLKKQTVSWYWNNLAYTMKPQHWIRRVWRSIHHAD